MSNLNAHTFLIVFPVFVLVTVFIELWKELELFTLRLYYLCFYNATANTRKVLERVFASSFISIILYYFPLQRICVHKREIRGESLACGKFESYFKCSFGTSEYVKYHIFELQSNT